MCEGTRKVPQVSSASYGAICLTIIFPTDLRSSPTAWSSAMSGVQAPLATPTTTSFCSSRPPIRYDDPRTYPLLLLPLLNPDADLSPPPSVLAPSESFDPAPAPTANVTMLYTGAPGFRAIDLAFCTLEPSSPLFSEKTTFTNWASSYSQTDVLLGTMGDTKVVLKAGDPYSKHGGRSEKVLWAEADLYAERLAGWKVFRSSWRRDGSRESLVNGAPL
ncbi:hypothetical protein FB451DRAFT_607168 [Mycena latifolia]|nr:hypothetical protein FB451DRAFT_607168 [Mycena latifolia]